MSAPRLARLPDRTPVKVTLMNLPNLHQRLVDHAAFDDQTDGPEVSIANLAPAALIAFLDEEAEIAKRKSEECS